MTVKLNSLTITEFNAKDIEKIKFVKEINNDKEICEFLTDDIKNWFIQSINKNKIQRGATYIIKKEEKNIGFIRFSSNLENDSLALDYGVHSKFRNQGYGSKILLEVSEYILKNSKIDKLALNINGLNRYSIKCAKNAGFKQEEIIDLANSNAVLIYRKHKKIS